MEWDGRVACERCGKKAKVLLGPDREGLRILAIEAGWMVYRNNQYTEALCAPCFDVWVEAEKDFVYTPQWRIRSKYFETLPALEEKT